MTTTTIDPSSTTALFEVAMESLRQHVLSGRRDDFFDAQPQFRPLVASASRIAARAKSSEPLRRTSADDDPQSGSVPPILLPVTETLKTQQQGVADSVSNGVSGAANDLAANRDTASFDAAMNARRQQTLEQSAVNINAAFDQATALGHANPDQQGDILAGMNFVSNIMNSFESLAKGLVSNVLGMVGSILQEGEQIVEGAIGAFTSAVSDVFSLF